MVYFLLKCIRISCNRLRFRIEKSLFLTGAGSRLRLYKSVLLFFLVTTFSGSCVKKKTTGHFFGGWSEFIRICNNTLVFFI